jgi:hypothetical protein
MTRQPPAPDRSAELIEKFGILERAGWTIVRSNAWRALHPRGARSWGPWELGRMSLDDVRTLSTS